MGTPGSRKHQVVVGGGFGGLPAVSKLRRAPVDVTLVDHRHSVDGVIRWSFSFATHGRGARLITQRFDNESARRDNVL